MHQGVEVLTGSDVHSSILPKEIVNFIGRSGSTGRYTAAQKCGVQRVS
jgi:hypothetical protein